MPPTFSNHSFKFMEGETPPNHISDWAGEVERKRGLWHIDGYDTFEGAEYPVASNIETIEDAELLARALRRRIEEAQPSATSGGQAFGGIQDRVYIVNPDGSKQIVRGSLD